MGQTKNVKIGRSHCTRSVEVGKKTPDLRLSSSKRSDAERRAQSSSFLNNLPALSFTKTSKTAKRKLGSGKFVRLA